MSAKYLGFVCFIYDLICPMECREMNGLLFLCNLSALTFSIFRGVGGRPGGTQKVGTSGKQKPVCDTLQPADKGGNDKEEMVA